MAADNETTALLPAQQNLHNLVFSEAPSVNAWATKYQLTQSTINRIVTGKMDPTTKVLQAIAEAMTRKGRPVEAWQFLAPNFGEGLLQVRTAATGETRVVPVTSAFPTTNARQGSGQRLVSSPYSKTNNPKRRSEDL